MRNVFVCVLSAMVGILLPTIAGAAIVLPSGGSASHPNPNTDVVQFTSVQLAAQEEWQFTVPDEFGLRNSKTVTLTGLLADPSQQARVWLSYPDAAGQVVETNWEIMYPPDLFFQAQLPLYPTQVTVHVKNRCDMPRMLNDVVYTAAYVPEPVTLGVLGIGVAALFVRRRIRL